MHLDLLSIPQSGGKNEDKPIHHQTIKTNTKQSLKRAQQKTMMMRIFIIQVHGPVIHLEVDWAWSTCLPTDRTVIKTRSVSQSIYFEEKKVTFERHVEGEKCAKNREVHISSR